MGIRSTPAGVRARARVASGLQVRLLATALGDEWCLAGLSSTVAGATSDGRHRAVRPVADRAVPAIGWRVEQGRRSSLWRLRWCANRLAAREGLHDDHRAAAVHAHEGWLLLDA